MTSGLRIYEAYAKWKGMGLKRSLNDEIADSMGVSRQTLWKWSKKPIKVEINGEQVECENWEDAYEKETAAARFSYEQAIKNQLSEGWRLLDVIQNEMLMKMAVKVKSEEYKPTLEDLKLITELCEKVHTRVDNAGQGTSGEVDKNLRFDIRFMEDDSE